MFGQWCEVARDQAILARLRNLLLPRCHRLNDRSRTSC
jgi:hypothetical protein